MTKRKPVTLSVTGIRPNGVRGYQPKPIAINANSRKLFCYLYFFLLLSKLPANALTYDIVLKLRIDKFPFSNMSRLMLLLNNLVKSLNQIRMLIG
ncbi:hypothetical protein SAMN05444682_103469 [Parapedobacter indicus]|uniref:Uncharacterized protein n=1 Tax=Parapedobacter indicus TaxID=1477437 RepID=A0A1I3HRW0_9SPHI|nr:hypothetical protein CLV26_103470 [Parapedobacter indicus]SFI38475.1 hypothetical protein SAMN05444682_103469 [Parapedobacter indicus]